MTEASLPTSVKLEISQPKRFGVGALLIMSLFGFVLAVPLLFAIVIISTFNTGVFLSVLIPLATILAMVFFLPFGFGNPYATKLVRSVHPNLVPDENNSVVQLTLVPRLRGGMRALFDDADDIGYLSVTPDELVFHGDSIQLALPWPQLGEVRKENVGLRGLFLYGGKIVLGVPGLPKIQALEFAERSSWFLPGSRRRAQQLYRRLRREVSGKDRATS